MTNNNFAQIKKTMKRIWGRFRFKYRIQFKFMKHCETCGVDLKLSLFSI